MTDQYDDLLATADTARAQTDQANNEVTRLCNGGKWVMRIPANPHRDSDIVISTALGALPTLADDVVELVDEVRRLRAAWNDTRAKLVEQADTYRHSFAKEGRSIDDGLATGFTAATGYMDAYAIEQGIDGIGERCEEPLCSLRGDHSHYGEMAQP